jgi:prepilin-type processing-associated H-X9-DG protein
MKLSAWLAALVLGQGPLISLHRDVVTLADGSAVALAPPVCVYTPTAERFSWSESGRYLLVDGISVSSFSPTSTAQPKHRIELIEWRTRKSTVISELPQMPAMNSAEWVGDDHYLVTRYEVLPSSPQRTQPATRHTLTLFRAGTTQSWPLYDSGEFPTTTPANVFAIPAVKHGYALVIDDRTGRSIDANRPVFNRKAIIVNFRTGKRTTITPTLSIGVDPEGYLYEPLYQDRKFTGQHRRYLPDGTMQEHAAKMQREPEEAAGPFQLMPSPAAHRIGKKTEVANGVWLASPVASDRQFALVAADCKEPKIAPDRSAIAYLHGGNLFVRELMTLGKAEFQQLLDIEEQNEAMNKAKQMATAIHIYMADSDDMFPPKEGFADLIMPYVKNRSMVDAFTYTFGKRNATEIAEPDKTEIGYVQGRKGRAVAYADGHVKWIKNP